MPPFARARRGFESARRFKSWRASVSAFGDVFRGPAEPVFSDELMAKVLIKEK